MISEADGSNIAAAFPHSSSDLGSESDISEAEGHLGRQMREVRGEEGAAMCT